MMCPVLPSVTLQPHAVKLSKYLEHCFGSHIAHENFLAKWPPICFSDLSLIFEQKNSQRLLSFREKFSFFCSNTTTEQRSKITDKNETHHVIARCLKHTCATLVRLHKVASSQETTKISLRSSVNPVVTVAIRTV